jgi:hypothetical protein
MVTAYSFPANPDRIKREHGKAIIPVCIGWQNSEGVKFAVLVKEARKLYGEVKFAIADDLYAYVEAIRKKTSVEDELPAARQRGKEWLKRAMEQGIVSSEQEIYFWRDFEDLPNHQEAKTLIDKRYMSDTDYQDSVELTISGRVNNPKYKQRGFNLGRYTDISRLYSNDEAVKYYQWALMGFNFVCHADELSDNLKYVYRNLIWPAYKDRVIYDQPKEINTKSKQSNVISLSESRASLFNRSSEKNTTTTDKQIHTDITGLNNNIGMLPLMVLLVCEKLEGDTLSKFKQNLYTLLTQFSPDFKILEDVMQYLNDPRTLGKFFYQQVGFAFKILTESNLGPFQTCLIQLVSSFGDTWLQTSLGTTVETPIARSYGMSNGS